MTEHPLDRDKLTLENTMEDLRGFGAAVLIVVFFIGVAVIVGQIIAGIVRLARRNERPSDFVGGIVHSMLKDAETWDYTADENWLVSDKAMLSVSLQPANYGRVCTRHNVNTGSSFIMNLEGKDLRAFRSALMEWKDRTAIERQHRIERWKRDAVMAMAA